MNDTKNGDHGTRERKEDKTTKNKEPGLFENMIVLNIIKSSIRWIFTFISIFLTNTDSVTIVTIRTLFEVSLFGVIVSSVSMIIGGFVINKNLESSQNYYSLVLVFRFIAGLSIMSLFVLIVIFLIIFMSFMYQCITATCKRTKDIVKQ